MVYSFLIGLFLEALAEKLGGRTFFNSSFKKKSPSRPLIHIQKAFWIRIRIGKLLRTKSAPLGIFLPGMGYPLGLDCLAWPTSEAWTYRHALRFNGYNED
jgi:hypothetical protein